MAITHFITHQLHLDENAELALRLRQAPCAVDDLAESLMADLKQAYLGRVNRQHGCFTEDALGQGLGHWLDQLAGGELDFLQLSERLAGQLLKLLSEQGAELRGHLLLFLEEQAGRQTLYLFLAQQRAATRINDRQEVEQVSSLDFGASLTAVKVDLGEWRSEQPGVYLSLSASRGGKGIAELIEQWVGFTATLDKAAATRDFLERIETFSQQLPEEQVGDFRNQVVQYCVEQDQQDAPVVIGGLAQGVDGIDSGAFASYLADNLPGGGTDLHLDRKSLQRYVKFAGRERDLAISFSSSQLNKRIHYNSDNDTLSISGLPKMLRSQLLGHIKQ